MESLSPAAVLCGRIHCCSYWRDRSVSDLILVGRDCSWLVSWTLYPDWHLNIKRMPVVPCWTQDLWNDIISLKLLSWNMIYGTRMMNVPNRLWRCSQHHMGLTQAHTNMHQRIWVLGCSSAASFQACMYCKHLWEKHWADCFETHEVLLIVLLDLR